MVFQKFKVMVDTVCTLNRKIRLRDGCISGLAWRPTSILSLERTWLGPDAEKGPVEIDEDAYQDEIGRFHDFRFHERFFVQFDSFLKSATCCGGMASALAKTDSVWNSGILGPKHRAMCNLKYLHS